MTRTMTGRTCLVTGATSGIGYATASALAARGARVVLLCRDETKARATVETIGGDTHVLVADLTDHASLHRAADVYLERFDALHVLINNAGAGFLDRRVDDYGVELGFSVNYLGHFVLTERLRPLLVASAPSRVVHLAGVYHRKGTLDFDDPWFETRPWDWGAANNQSQLARVVFAIELARRLDGTGVVSNAVHPGAVLTNAQRDLPWYFKLLIHTLARPGFVGPERGARPVVRLASDPGLETVTGRFFDRAKERRTIDAAYDAELGARLWAFTEALAAARDRRDAIEVSGAA